MMTINNINNNITKLFQNQNINFFIIMMLILLISCYTFINTSLKYALSSFVSNPIIILFCLIFIIFISYYSINIAVLILLLLFIILYGTTIFNNKKNNITNKNINNIEGFINNEDENEDVDEDEDEDENNNNKNQYQDEDEDEDEDNIKIINSSNKKKELDDAKKDETVNKITSTILGTMNSIKDAGNNEFKKSLIENKQIQLRNEKKNNKNSNSNSKNTKSTFKNLKKENFQTIEKRAFDPNTEEDTNFLITKEILQDMINRIEYNFESSKYLKKYLKHRVEEIVDINKLLEDDD